MKGVKNKKKKKSSNPIYTASYFKKLKKLTKLTKLKQTDKILKLKFGRFLMLLRTDAKLTQQQTADELGIHRTSWAKYEAGTMLPTRSRIYEIAELFKTDVAGLFHRSGYGGALSHWDNQGEYEKVAVRKLRDAMKNSTSLGQFLHMAHLAWNDYQNAVESPNSDGRVGSKLAKQLNPHLTDLPLIDAVRAVNAISPEKQIELIGEVLLGESSKDIARQPFAYIALNELITKLNDKYKKQNQ